LDIAIGRHGFANGVVACGNIREADKTLSIRYCSCDRLTVLIIDGEGGARQTVAVLVCLVNLNGSGVRSLLFVYHREGVGGAVTGFG